MLCKEKRVGLRWEPLISLFKSLLLHPDDTTVISWTSAEQRPSAKTARYYQKKGCFDDFWHFVAKRMWEPMKPVNVRFRRLFPWSKAGGGTGG